MKRILPFALCLIAGPAFAAPLDGGDVGRLDVVGEAHGACVISPPDAGSGTNTAFQRDIRIVDLVDPQTAQARAASINLAFPVICNAAHRVVVRTQNGAMRRGGPAAAPAPGFRDSLPYDLSVTWAGQTASGTSQAPIDITLGDGAAGVLSLAVAIAPGGAPLIAGQYADALVVELQAAN